jgi:hypothetical protein
MNETLCHVWEIWRNIRRSMSVTKRFWEGPGWEKGDIRRSGENEGRSSEIRARCRKILGEYRVIWRSMYVTKRSRKDTDRFEGCRRGSRRHRSKGNAKRAVSDPG